MEGDILNNNVLAFDAPKEHSSYIKVIGVGGGGGNAVNHMYRQGITGVDFIVCNTDEQSLNASPVPNKIKLGKNGLGAGNKPDVARNAALEKSDEIKDIISHNTKMLFITAGMGGGTGTGAAPVIAELAKQIDIDDDVDKILVVAIVTLPFAFEGPRRRRQAEEGIQELRKYVDSILIVNNDKLRDFGDASLSNAFSKADDILLTAAKGIAEIITVSAYVAIDFRDVNTVMQNSGTALMGAGIADGENRAIQAIELAATSVLLNDNDISGAKNILLYFSYSKDHEITMDELGYITNYIDDLTGGEADLIWGAGADDSLEEKLSITLVATGFESKKRFDLPATPKPNKLVLDSEEVKKEEAPKEEEIHIKAQEPIVLQEPIFEIPKPTFEISVEKPKAIVEQPIQEPHVTVHHLFEEEVTSKANVRTHQNSCSEDGIELKKVSPQIESAVEQIAKTVHTIEIPHMERVDDDIARKRAERIARIHAMVNSSEGLAELEKRPAYEILDMDIYQTPSSNVSDVKGSLSRDGNIIMKSPYLHENPD